MKILIGNKFYYPKGGPETNLFKMEEFFEDAGHTVIPFSMKHPKNKETEFSRFFVENIDYNNQNIALFQKIKQGFKLIYSFEAKRKIGELIRQTKPDIAHLNNIYHQISPSIIDAIKRFKIPIVMTLRDYKLICSNYLLFRNKTVCEKCKGNRFYNTVIYRCVKDSVAASTLNMIEMYIHSMLKVYHKVNLFISPSDFLRKKMIEFGMDESKIVHLANCISIKDYEPCYSSNSYLLYFGNFLPHKGVDILLETMGKFPEMKLLLAGSGGEEKGLKRYAEEHNLRNVEFLGFLTGEKLKTTIQQAKFIIAPSVCYENCSMTILESFAYGKPVIGSRIGGIPEQIEDGMNGLLFEPGNADELAEKIQLLWNSPEKVVEMGKNARRIAEVKYSAGIHYEKLIKIYERLIRNEKC